MYVLTVTHGPDSGRQIRLTNGGRYTIGTNEDASLRLSDPKVLENHCTIQVPGGQPILVNHTASAGTFIANRKIAKARLKPGVSFRIGDTVLTLTAERRVRPVQEESDPLLGKMIGGYKLNEVVGRGGMGTVYKATQLSLHREVALKVLRPTLAQDEGFRQLFINEARAAAQLVHPNVVQVYDAGTEGETSFFSMEYMGQGSVEELLQRDSKVRWQDAILMVLEAAHGLEFAESRGIVHRDIKPDNLMLNDDGQVKLADLGLAKRGEQAKGEGIIGTPHFIPPEQALGKGEVDTRADIYSLGATFFRMITGKTVFTGKTAKEIVLKHISEPPPAASGLEPEVPEELDAVLGRMLAKDPDHRHQTVGELIGELEEICAQHGIKGAIIRRGVGKRVIIPIVALLLAAVGLVIFLASRGPEQLVDLKSREEAAEAQRIAEERARQLAEQQRESRRLMAQSERQALENQALKLPALEDTYDDPATAPEREESWLAMAEKYRDFAISDLATEFELDAAATTQADTIIQRLREFKEVQGDKREKIDAKSAEATKIAEDLRLRLASLRADRRYADASLLCGELAAEKPGPKDPFDPVRSWVWVSPINDKNRVPATKIERIVKILDEAREYFEKESPLVLREADGYWETVRARSEALLQQKDPTDENIEAVIEELAEFEKRLPASGDRATPPQIEDYITAARRIRTDWEHTLQERHQQRLLSDRESVRSTLRKLRSLDPDVIPNHVMNAEIPAAIEAWRKLLDEEQVRTQRYRDFVLERVRMLQWVDYIFTRFHNDVRLSLADDDTAPLRTLDFEIPDPEGGRPIRDRFEQPTDNPYEFSFRRRIENATTRRFGQMPMDWVYHACFFHEGEPRWTEMTPVLEFALGAFCLETMQFRLAGAHFANLVGDERYGAAARILAERCKLEQEARTEYVQLLRAGIDAKTSVEVDEVLRKLASFSQRHEGTLFYIDVMRTNDRLRRDFDGNVVPDLPAAPPPPS